MRMEDWIASKKAELLYGNRAVEYISTTRCKMTANSIMQQFVDEALSAYHEDMDVEEVIQKELDKEIWAYKVIFAVLGKRKKKFEIQKFYIRERRREHGEKEN